MKWEMKEARYGDIVRVSLGAIYHFGIFVSEDEIIQFGLPPTPDRRAEDVEVLSAPVGDFLAGGFLEVGCCEGNEKRRRRNAKKTVAAAKARLGEKGYDIIHNNCEHFANECAFGEKFSSMTDGLRAKFRAVPIVHIYLEKFPFPVESDKIFPPSRAKEIESCSNPQVRNQKYFVWKLLENALYHSFGLKIDKLNLKKQDSGKWECDECCFSLSHCDGFAAVAVSRKPIGVDIEKCDKSRFNGALAEKITTEKEGEGLKNTGGTKEEELCVLWTKKEAIFKQSGGKSFQPGIIETSNYATVTKKFAVDGESYFISVASEDAPLAVFKSSGCKI